MNEELIYVKHSVYQLLARVSMFSDEEIETLAMALEREADAVRSDIVDHVSLNTLAKIVRSYKEEKK